jgi:hypothetical protein
MRTNLMGMGQSHIRMGVSMRGSSRRGRNKGGGSLGGLTERCILDNFIKGKCKAAEL